MPPATVTLRQLEQLARAFDAISDETGARYSAGAFVAFVRDELAALSDLHELRREHLEAGALRRWAAAR